MQESIAADHRPALVIHPAAPDVAADVADRIEAIWRNTTPRIVGLATGGTPVPVYRELVDRHRVRSFDADRIRTFNLDEYVGLSPRHPQSYAAFMRDQLFDSLGIDPRRGRVPSGIEPDPAAYEAEIAAAGGIDWQLLGIGRNGHIGFNEPGSPRDCRTRIVALTEDTIAANSRFFSQPTEVPTTAITMGIATILSARSIVLMAVGESKAEAIRLAIEGEIDANHPASFLRTRDDVTFVIDSAAASRL